MLSKRCESDNFELGIRFTLKSVRLFPDLPFEVHRIACSRLSGFGVRGALDFASLLFCYTCFLDILRDFRDVVTHYAKLLMGKKNKIDNIV